MFYEHTLDGAIKLYIQAKPNSSFTKFGEVLETGKITIHLTEAPEGGKANQQLINFLSKYFKIPKTSIILEKGERTKYKTVIFLKISEELQNFLQKY